MLVKHYLTITAVCPVDQKMDVYEAVIECDRVLRVEEIIAAVDKCTRQPEFQEAITRDIARELAVKVTTTGYHSGVKTVCEC